MQKKTITTSQQEATLSSNFQRSLQQSDMSPDMEECI